MFLIALQLARRPKQISALSLFKNAQILLLICTESEKTSELSTNDVYRCHKFKQLVNGKMLAPVLCLCPAVIHLKKLWPKLEK